jgi:copper(I)-binding protein
MIPLARANPLPAALLVAACAAALFPFAAAMIGQARAQAARAAEEQTYTLGSLVIAAPWARATPAGASVGGAYLKITNRGTTPDRLIGGSLPTAAAVEVHEVTLAGGVAKMRRLADGLEIKAGETVELKPGGYHIMFVGLKAPLRQGESITGTLQFAKAGTIEVAYRIAPIGAMPSGHMHH